MNKDKTKLRDNRLSEETAETPATKPNQRNTKYSQRFTPEAAKVSNEPVPPPASPEKQTPAKPETDRRNNGKLTFSFDEKSGIKSDKAKAEKKTTKLQHNADTVSEKLEKARSKAGKVSSNQKRQSGGKFRSDTNRGSWIRMAGVAALHNENDASEHDNAGIQSAHHTEYAVGQLYGAGKSVGRSTYRFARESPVRKATKLETKSMKANMRLDLQRKAGGNPNMKSNTLSRYMQKRRIKKQYQKAAREARRGVRSAKKTTAGQRKRRRPLSGSFQARKFGFLPGLSS
jgi:hypothetical protein